MLFWEIAVNVDTTQTELKGNGCFVLLTDKYECQWYEVDSKSIMNCFYLSGVSRGCLDLCVTNPQLLDSSQVLGPQLFLDQNEAKAPCAQQVECCESRGINTCENTLAKVLTV